MVKDTLRPDTGVERTDLGQLKDELTRHRLYARVCTPEALRVFMEHHVVCVWDFMSLLKSLQRDLAPAGTPWLPPADPEAARLLNEIVLDEETDRLPHRNGHGSHFEWYLDAMVEVGCDLAPVERWLAAMRDREPSVTCAEAGLPAEAIALTL